VWGSTVAATVLWMLVAIPSPSARGQEAANPPVPANGGSAPEASAPKPPFPATPPAEYVIGPDDILNIVFWREQDLSGDFVVRPDGKISLPLLNDVQAAGNTPAQLKAALEQQAAKYFEEPNATVIVKAIRSRAVYITGQVLKPGPYQLTTPLTVIQLIALAGGLTEYADGDHITVLRTEKGWPMTFPFNYNEVAKRKYLRNNILLKPGDTVIVP
jgi:polysaccharide export outer membrane protein